jgi:lipopolysaccharide/colanic/teichoic acid biosynthesis glycosyltransferase
VIGLTALAVLAGGGRPVLYRGQRVGRAGRVFTMYKFRTLRPTPSSGSARTSAPSSRR